MSRVVNRTVPGGACSVNRQDFTKAFHDVPQITISSFSDVKTRIDQAIAILSKTQEDWTKRMNQLKLIRSVIIHSENVIGKDQLLSQLLRLIDCLDLSVKDLRSQILREAAVTCSFIVVRFGNDVHQIGEKCLLAAFSQVSVSTKVMATSGIILTSFIVQYVQTKQVFTCLMTYSTSKDKSQRRQLAELLEIVVDHWSDKMKKIYIGQICELVKSAVCDADPETRAAGRKAFHRLDLVHSEEAEHLFQSVDLGKQKMLRAADANSSCNSVNSEHGSVPMKAKLSSGSIVCSKNQNISSKFLSQRSASAIDTKQITRISSSKMESVKRTPNTYSKLNTRGIKMDTSPGGSKFVRPAVNLLGPRSSSNLRAQGNVVASQPGSRHNSPPRRGSINVSSDMQRVKSNLGSNSFVSSLTTEEAEKFQKVLNSAKEHLGQPSRTDEDEFLLPKRQKTKTPQKNAIDLSRVESVIRACSSTSANERKEGIKLLATVVCDPTLTDMEVKNIGLTLNRLLSDVTNLIVLEAVTIFVQTHNRRLSEWLKIGLGKLFTKKGSEVMPNMKRQISSTVECVLSTFDPSLQLKSTCELMCDPIHLLTPKARIALLEYLSDLLDKHMERGSSFNRKEVRATIMKMFSWMTDQRIGQMMIPFGEKVICSLFSLNATDFSILFNDFNSDYRDWAFRILHSHGHDLHQREVNIRNEPGSRANISNTVMKIENIVEMRKSDLPSEAENISIPKTGVILDYDLMDSSKKLSGAPSSEKTEEMNLNESFDRLKLNSTTHLIDDTTEQGKYVTEKIGLIMNGSPLEQHEGLLSIQTMLCEGSFTLWEQNFAKLLIAIFDTLSQSQSDANKKLALRVLAKMCTSQATRLFDSTEAAVCKVLDAAVDSKDGTMNVTADDCLRTLATYLPLPKIVAISKVILNQEKLQEARASLVLKMMTRVFDCLQYDELNPVVEDLAPSVIKAYDSPSSLVRKTAVYCLVAMVNKLGMKVMEPYLQKLSSGKLNLIQVYVDRAMSSSVHSHV